MDPDTEMVLADIGVFAVAIGWLFFVGSVCHGLIKYRRRRDYE